jgi:hypothetical protein
MNDDGNIEAMLERAAGLAASGDYPAAIDWLRACHRRIADVRVERLLAEYRYQAYLRDPPQPARATPWPSQVDDLFAGVAGVPEINAQELNAATLTAGIRRHGALLVRGLLSEPRALAMAAGVQHAMDACEAWHRTGMGESESPWYSRLALPADCEIAPARVWVEEAGGVWTVDSPRMLQELIECFAATGVTAAIEGYFGERAMLSVGKSTLRRVPSTIKLADWHQDGAFMGSEIRSVNCWLSLSHCGEDASGLDILPRRLEQVLPTGSHGAYFDWSVGAGMVEQAAEGLAMASPVFAPGDAMLFDHFFLHRTGIPAAIARDRYAIESWFFAPSAYPAQQVPLRL